MIGMICERYIQPIIDKMVGLLELNKVLIIVMEHPTSHCACFSGTKFDQTIQMIIKMVNKMEKTWYN